MDGGGPVQGAGVERQGSDLVAEGLDPVGGQRQALLLGGQGGLQDGSAFEADPEALGRGLGGARWRSTPARRSANSRASVSASGTAAAEGPVRPARSGA